MRLGSVLRGVLLGVGAFAAVNLWFLCRGIEQQAWIGEYYSRKDAVIRAELAWFDAHGEYVACGDRETALRAAVEPNPRVAAEDPTLACLRRGVGLSVSPQERTRTGLWVDVDRDAEARATGFVVHTVCDLDGDGRVRESTFTSIGPPSGAEIGRGRFLVMGDPREW